MQDAVQKHPGDFSSTHRGAQHPWGACPVLRDALPVPVELLGESKAAFTPNKQLYKEQ